jgi:hypothetical protein
MRACLQSARRSTVDLLSPPPRRSLSENGKRVAGSLPKPSVHITEQVGNHIAAILKPKITPGFVLYQVCECL